MGYTSGSDVPAIGDLDGLAVVKVRVGSLLDSDSPRLSGEDLGHVRALAGVEGPLPPIIVHRQTMRVIDGMHRLRAARSRGDKEVDARFFDGDEASSFVLAVQANILHGLPLSLADRKAAASRIISSYPQWSDRMIAAVSGVAARTVAAIRACPTGGGHQLDTPHARVGRDGRVRPVNSAERRSTAARLMADSPDASLREIAREAGISPETARDVRARLRRDDGPVPLRRDAAGEGVRRPARVRPLAQASGASPDGMPVLRALMADPALRLTDSGRSLLRMLASYRVLEEHGIQLTETIPAHRMASVADAARACARAWQDFADRVDQRRKVISKANWADRRPSGSPLPGDGDRLYSRPRPGSAPSLWTLVSRFRSVAPSRRGKRIRFAFSLLFELRA